MTADENTNRKNLWLLIQLRWFAVGGQVLTILIVHRGLGVALPLLAMSVVIAFLVALNLISHIRHYYGRDITNVELFSELLLDIVALTIQLHLSGGATNPFIALYLLQVALGAVLLRAWSVWLLVGVTAAAFVWLMRSYLPLALPEGADLLTLYIQGAFVTFVLAAALLTVFIQRIDRNLRIRDAHLADLRQRAAEETHIVRMGLLASGAAHELGTPLATLSVILNDWRRLPLFKGDPDLVQEIAEMQGQIDRCKAIVTGILMSSGEARGEAPTRTTVNRFVDEMVSEWRSHRSPPILASENRFAPDATIVADSVLKQIVFNLFDNAIEASPHWVGIAVERADDHLVVTVTDRGPGFRPEILAEFGKPYRSTKGRPGSGLGLFLVVNVMRKLGGAVDAANRPEGGAQVRLSLPLESLSAEERHG